MDDQKTRRDDKRISLAPLNFEQALGGILAAGPHVDDEDDAPESVKKHHEQKHKRQRQKESAPSGALPNDA